jgi:hypothetical protein
MASFLTECMSIKLKNGEFIKNYLKKLGLKLCFI